MGSSTYVPVKMISPGSRVVPWLRKEIVFLIPKIISLVLLFCLLVSLRHLPGDCAAYLHGLAVDLGEDLKVLGVSNDLVGDDARTEGRPAIKALTQRPLATAMLNLPVTMRHIVTDGVAQYVVECLILRYVRGSLANNDDQLTLIVKSAASLGNRMHGDGVGRTGQRSHGFVLAKSACRSSILE